MAPKRTRPHTSRAKDQPARKQRKTTSSSAAERNQQQEGSRTSTPAADNVIQEVTNASAHPRRRVTRPEPQQRQSASIQRNENLPSTQQHSQQQRASDDSEEDLEVADWRNSTTLQARSTRSVSDEFVLQFGNILEQTLYAVRDNVRETVQNASFSVDNSHLVNRMTTAKRLPAFYGDALEWLNFKEAYNLTTKLGEYNNDDNMSRLFDALKGDARKIVSTLLATSRDPDAIMKTLELHYGNKNDLARRVAADLKDLPVISSGRISLIQFATKLKNAVSTFKMFKLVGYLHNPDLIRSIADKIPETLKYAYTAFI